MVSFETRPNLGLPASFTCARFLTKIGTELILVTIIFSISEMLLSNPIPLTTKACPFLSITSPPTFTLLFPTALNTSSAERPYFVKLFGFTLISKLLSSPPKLFTSATPGTLLNSLSNTQSWSVYSSLIDLVLLFKVYRNISPVGPYGGSTSGLIPSGRSTFPILLLTC